MAAASPQVGTRSAPTGFAALFCPADRPDRYAKALAAADTVILDLEDAVALEHKESARESLRAALPELPVDRTVVRINSPRTAAGQADLAMVRESPLRVVLVPKVEDPREVEALAPLAVIALCETACGVQRAPQIAAATGCVGLMWGGEDLTADIGGHRSRGPDGQYLPHVQYARGRILIAAASARVRAWDGVYLDIADLAGLKKECDEAVSMGFAAKVAIHPSHAAVIREAYRPSVEQVAWAERLLSAVRTAGSGVVNFEGRMVDGPLITMARSLLAADTGKTADRTRDAERS